MRHTSPLRLPQIAFRRLCTLGVSLPLLLIILSTTHVPAANASWAGGHCSSEHHCYALTYWCPSAEKNIHDIWVYEDTTNMNVPEPSSGYFVDNEMWVSWSCSGNGEWIEAGQAAGWPRTSSTVIYPFYAKKNNNGGYEEYVGYSEAKQNVGNLYKIARSSTTEGEWCVEWGHTLERCYEGFKSGPARALEEGVEAATASEPTNKGFGEGFALGGVNDWWEGSISAEIITESGTCASSHSPGPGSLNYGAGKGC
jgi:hypothetical protein